VRASLDRRRVRSGDHFMIGDVACAEAALAAGCQVFAGYPITPASEIAEHMSQRLPMVGGYYMQMEDELASMNAILGASCAGVRSMTATSGPGFSLMAENLGLGMMMEVPCVVVDIMRGGPSTGMPTLTSQGDVMQSRWGSHGDYEPVVYAPASVQEMFDLTIRCFNTADRYRVPTILLGDQMLGHMTGHLRIPPEDEIPWVERPTRSPPGDPDPVLPSGNGALPMAHAGEGHRLHFTGLTHDERGYPAIDPAGSRQLLDRIVGKIRDHLSEIVEVEDYRLDGAELAVVAFGSNSRSAREAVRRARADGIPVGMLRLVTLWPFAEEAIVELSRQVSWILVPEINYGQIVHPVREYAECPVSLLPHAGGALHHPDDIVSVIRRRWLHEDGH